MRIEDRKPPARMQFEDLIIGDTFSCNGDLCLRIEDLIRSDGCVISNAVILNRNAVGYFNADTEVYLAPCHITLE